MWLSTTATHCWLQTTCSEMAAVSVCSSEEQTECKEGQRDITSVKTVPDMTYNVFGWTLNLAQPTMQRAAVMDAEYRLLRMLTRWCTLCGPYRLSSVQLYVILGNVNTSFWRYIHRCNIASMKVACSVIFVTCNTYCAYRGLHCRSTVSTQFKR